jgi:NAD-dependent dihydropyrimidine dehydrogenase PreA subunit
MRMLYVVTEPCIGTKNRACLEACPVSCIEEGHDQSYIDPNRCIACGACAAVCPVNAIYDELDVPRPWRHYIRKNVDHFANRG